MNDGGDEHAISWLGGTTTDELTAGSGCSVSGAPSNTPYAA